MFEEITHDPTFGEKLVQSRLSKLPKKEFFFEYEPQLNTSNGKSSKPDFIVVSAALGVAVIEVKDWVKITGGDQDRIDIIQTDGIPQRYPNPVLVVQRYAYDLKERFEARAELWETYKGHKRLKFPWQTMVVLTNISQGTISQFEEKGIWPQRTVIGREIARDAAAFEQAIRSLPWVFKLQKPLTLDMLDLIREIINPQLVVSDADGNPIGTLTRLQEKLINDPVRILSLRQMTLLEAEDDTAEMEPEVRLVRGVAGSGKTLVLIRRARQIIDRYPDARVLVMTFNVEIAEDLRRRISLPEQLLDITNFHKVCTRILGRNWRTPLDKRRWLKSKAAQELDELDLPVEFVADEIAWRVERDLCADQAYLEADRKGRGYRLDRAKQILLNQIFNRYQAFKRDEQRAGRVWFDWDDVAIVAAEALQRHELRETYHAILIDEAQDFTPSWVRLVRLLLKPGGALFICDDPSQSIFHSYSWAQKALPVMGKSMILRVPFRSTREISQAAHSLIDADENLCATEERPEPDFSSYELVSGPLPELLECRDADDEIATITRAVHKLMDAGAPTANIAILCQYRYQVKAWEQLQQVGVYVNYFEKMKGLEFNVVFVPHLHELFSDADDAETISAKRRKVFTAMTRARYRLTLTYQSALPVALTPLLNFVQQETLTTR